MPFTTLSDFNQTGEIKVDATKHSDLPGLKNDTSKELRISFTATGTWCLYNVPTKDSALAVFNAQTDWKGYQLPKATHDKYKWRQADAPAGALLVEIFDAQGARKTVLASPASVDLPPGGSVTFVVNDDPSWYANNSGHITLNYKCTLPLPGGVSQGTVIKLQSNKGDFLHRAAEPWVTTWSAGVGCEWTVEVIGGDKIRLRTWRDDYLWRTNDPKDFLYPNEAPKKGISIRGTSNGDEWSVEVIGGNKIRLRSCKDDYLYRSDAGVSTSNTGAGTEWVVEVVRPAATPAPAP